MCSASSALSADAADSGRRCCCVDVDECWIIALSASIPSCDTSAGA